MSNEQRKMAWMLGLSQNHEESWPMDIIDRLIAYEKTASRREFQSAVAAIMGLYR